MKIDYAPMDGVTNAICRNAHHRYFGGISRYWMPFWSPTQNHVLPPRVRRDIDPVYNENTPVVPQLLTKSADDFIWAAGVLRAMGYEEVNLNLGCPSGTVAAKGKGAGFLAYPEQLAQFLDEIFAASPLPISIKTRLGVEHTEEFAPLLALYHRYPVRELTVHVRVQQDFYKHAARPEEFSAIYEKTALPLAYNGDIRTEEDCAALSRQYPKLTSLMIGRALIADPALAVRAQGGKAADIDTLHAFYNELYERHCEEFKSKRNAMMRMKEFWRYLILHFEDGESYAKKLRKATDTEVFEAAAESVFRDLTLLERPRLTW